MVRIGRDAGAVMVGTGTGLGDVQNRESSTTFGDTLSIRRGRHSLRTGTEIIYYVQNIYSNNNRRGQINFQSFTDFLLGNVNSSTYGDGIGLRSMRTTDYGFFVQDDWKFSRKLTLNLGLRYELDMPPYETRGSNPTFDPTLYKPRPLSDTAVTGLLLPLSGFVQPRNVIVQNATLAGRVFDRDIHTPYFHQYNTSVQYAVSTSLLLEVAYVGTRALDLFRDVGINQARLAGPQQPIINEVTGAVITTNTPANVQLRAPFQGVEISGFSQRQSTAQSSYNSLQMSLTK